MARKGSNLTIFIHFIHLHLQRNVISVAELLRSSTLMDEEFKIERKQTEEKYEGKGRGKNTFVRVFVVLFTRVSRFHVHLTF
jgi:hypothetical protein